MEIRDLSKLGMIHAIKFIILNSFNSKKFFDIYDIMDAISEKYKDPSQQLVEEAIDDMLSKGELSVAYLEEPDGWFYIV